MLATPGPLARSLSIVGLLALAPFMRLYARNLGSYISLRELSVYALVAIAISVAVGLLLWWLGGSRRGRLLAAWAAAVFASFQYGFVASELAERGASPAAQLGAWLALLAVLVLLAWELARRTWLAHFLLLFAVLSLVPPLIDVARQQPPPTGPGLARADAFPVAGNPVWSGKPVRRPNIYWVVLDSYPGRRLLEGPLRFDNRPFYRALAGRGFASVEPSFAAYSNTLLSVSSTLDMEYLFDANDRFSRVDDGVRHTLPGRANRDPVQTIAGDNRSVSHLTQIGYRYLHFEGRTFHLTRCRGYEDACISGMPTRRSDLLATVLAQLPHPLLSLVSSEYSEVPRPVRKGERSASGTGIPELAAALAEQPADEPFFLYAHIFSPHPPFTNDAECRASTQRSADDYLDDFLAQLQCVNRQLLALVDGILERDPEALILVNSDHGPRFSAPDDLSIFEFGPAQIYEHLNVLNTVRLPEPCRRYLRPKLSPLNSMRLVFACLGGHAPRYLEERHFIAAVRPDHPDYGRIREVELR